MTPTETRYLCGTQAPVWRAAPTFTIYGGYEPLARVTPYISRTNIISGIFSVHGVADHSIADLCRQINTARKLSLSGRKRNRSVTRANEPDPLAAKKGQKVTPLYSLWVVDTIYETDIVRGANASSSSGHAMHSLSTSRGQNEMHVPAPETVWKWEENKVKNKHRKQKIFSKQG